MQYLRTGIHNKPSSHFGAFSNKCTKGKKLHLKSDTITYLFSFNGKEKIDEINGAGNDIDFGARVYDASLGRWLSLDPLQAIYPHLSPYSFAGNSPILFIDLEGKKIINGMDKDKNPTEYAKVEAAIAAVKDKNIELYTLMQEGRIYNGVVVLSNDPNYSRGQDIIVNITIANIDEQDAIQESQNDLASQGANVQKGKGELHRNGQTSFAMGSNSNFNITSVNGESVAQVNLKPQNSTLPVPDIWVSLGEKSIINQTTQVQLIQTAGINPTFLQNTFNIRLDDYQNNDFSSITYSQDYLYAKSLAHEFGHISGATRNPILALYFLYVLNDMGGHMNGNPSGDQARQEESKQQ